MLSNKTFNLKKIKNIKPINTHEYDFVIKKNLLKDINEKYFGNETENYQNFLAGLEDPAEEMEPQHYYFHSNVVNDAQMKNNIYLPKIMDRMRYSIPRNERDKNGFLVEGKALFSKRVNHNDEFKINYEIN